MHNSVAGSAPQDQTRPLDPLRLKSKERLRKEVDPEISGQSQKAIAIDLRVDEAQLSRYLGDQYRDDIPAHKVPALTRSIGPGYMEWLGIQCGGVYHHGEQAPHCHQSVTTLIGLLAKQSGSVVQQLLQDLDKHLAVNNGLPGLRRLKTIVEATIQEAEGAE